MRKTHWLLALALVIFMQVTLASHHHDEPATSKHDCVLCSQQHMLDAVPATSAVVNAATQVTTLYLSSHSESLTQLTRLRPPARAPPSFS